MKTFAVNNCALWKVTTSMWWRDNGFYNKEHVTMRPTRAQKKITRGRNCGVWTYVFYFNGAFVINCGPVNSALQKKVVVWKCYTVIINYFAVERDQGYRYTVLRELITWVNCWDLELGYLGLLLVVRRIFYCKHICNINLSECPTVPHTISIPTHTPLLAFSGSYLQPNFALDKWDFLLKHGNATREKYENILDNFYLAKCRHSNIFFSIKRSA